jgi:hypothetical protein
MYIHPAVFKSEVEDVSICWTCDSYSGDKERVNNFVWKLGRKPLGRPMNRWDDGIKMNLIETGREKRGLE